MGIDDDLRLVKGGSRRKWARRRLLSGRDCASPVGRAGIPSASARHAPTHAQSPRLAVSPSLCYFGLPMPPRPLPASP